MTVIWRLERLVSGAFDCDLVPMSVPLAPLTAWSGAYDGYLVPKTLTLVPMPVIPRLRLVSSACDFDRVPMTDIWCL